MDEHFMTNFVPHEKTSFQISANKWELINQMGRENRICTIVHVELEKESTIELRK